MARPYPQHLQYRPNFKPRGRPWQSNQRPFEGRTPMPMRNYNEEYWCETCDRGFPNISVFEIHKQQHQKCNIDGCQFVAHPKVVTKHIQMQHSSGLFKKIANLNNPAEIQKWIDERKKKYPTKLNVEKKAAEVLEKIGRGEKMGLNYNKNFRNHQSGNSDKVIGKKRFSNENREKNKKPKHSHFVTNNRKNSTVKKDNKVLPAVKDKRTLKPFAGIQDLVVDCEVDNNVEEACQYFIDDEDCEHVSVVEAVGTSSIEPAVCGALSSLMCNYGSSDEEIDSINQKSQGISQPGNVKESTIPDPREGYHKIPSLLQDNKQVNGTTKLNNETDDDSGPEEVQVNKKDNSENTPELTTERKVINEKITKRKENFSTREHKITKTKFKSKLPSTLLQKLLHKEIQHERNAVLQCIRYIVKNKYFDST